MPVCGARSAGGPSRLDELEEEHAELEEAVQQFRRSAEESEALLPAAERDLQTAEAWGAEEAAAVKRATLRRRELESELEECSAVGPTGGAAAPHAVASRDLGAGEDAQSQAAEAEHLTRELAGHKAGEAAVVGEGVRALVAAEGVAAELRDEVAALRSALAEAEATGRTLAEEHRQAEAEQQPLHDWLGDMDGKLRLARAENAELTASLAAAREHQRELEADEAEARPMQGSGLDAIAICWLQEHERTSVARRAALAEELAAERCRRESLLDEAAKYRQEAAAEERRQRRRREVGEAASSGGAAAVPPRRLRPTSLRGAPGRSAEAGRRAGPAAQGRQAAATELEAPGPPPALDPAEWRLPPPPASPPAAAAPAAATAARRDGPRAAARGGAPRRGSRRGGSSGDDGSDAEQHGYWEGFDDAQ